VARVSRVGRGDGFVWAIVAENRPISIGRPRAWGQNQPAGRGIQRAGPQSERRQLNAARGGERVHSRPWVKIVFHCYFFTITVLLIFVEFF
jgi:hypothetical protein